MYTGVTLVLICLLHGATFLSLKTTGDLHERSGRLARRVAPFTAAAVVGFADLDAYLHHRHVLSPAA